MDEETIPANSNGHPESSNGSEKPSVEHIAGDPSITFDPAEVEQWKRWTFAQIDNGRSAEDVTSELISSGWAAEPAAALVDEMARRAEAVWTRSSLAQDRSILSASRSRIPPPMGRFSFVGSIANVFIALYRLLFPDPEEDMLLQKKSPEKNKEQNKSQ